MNHVEDLHTAFSRTEYGQTLSQRTRFSRFRLEFVSHKHWKELLGDDACNLNHMVHTLGITKKFLEKEPSLTLEEKELLCIAAITHDWAEAIVGDIPLPWKTEEDEKTEEIHYEDIFLSLSPQPELCDQLREIIFRRTTILGQMFQAIEEIGYIGSAIRAWEKAKTHPIIEVRRALVAMAKEVIGNSLPSLQIHAASFPFAHEFIMNNITPIQDIYYSIYTHGKKQV